MDTAARRGIWWPGRSTLSATCMVAGTVQESLWKLREKYYRGTFLSAQLEESSPRLCAFTVQPGQDKEGTVKMVKSLKQSGRATRVLSASDPGSFVDL